MRPSGVHHVSINVPDVDEGIAFYTDVLGLSLRTDRPDFGFPGAWLDCGGQQVHLIEAGKPQELGQHFALEVDDIAGVIHELRGRGIEVSDPSPVNSGFQAFLRDPAGNAVELNQPTS